MFTFVISASGTRLFDSRAVIVAALALLACAGAAPAADGPHLGQPISPADAAAWDISIGPDGVGLPPGSGTPAQGAVVYADHGCAACHGDQGGGGPAGPLGGGGVVGGPRGRGLPRRPGRRRAGRPTGRRWSAQRHRSRSGEADRQLL